ncbi:hypothetical protein ACP4OV_013069 [Aristida adscensionis]
MLLLGILISLQSLLLILAPPCFLKGATDILSAESPVFKKKDFRKYRPNYKRQEVIDLNKVIGDDDLRTKSFGASDSAPHRNNSGSLICWSPLPFDVESQQYVRFENNESRLPGHIDFYFKR